MVKLLVFFFLVINIFYFIFSIFRSSFSFFIFIFHFSSIFHFSFSSFFQTFDPAFVAILPLNLLDELFSFSFFSHRVPPPSLFSKKQNQTTNFQPPPPPTSCPIKNPTLSKEELKKKNLTGLSTFPLNIDFEVKIFLLILMFGILKWPI